MNRMNIKISLFIVGMTLFSMKVLATQSAVNSKTCKKLTGTNSPFILVLRRDQNLFDAINQCLHDMHVPAASFSGVGALKNVTAGFYNPAKKKLDFTHFSGNYYSIAALDGSLTSNQDGSPFVHVHAVLADNQFAAVISGHIKDAVVADNVEIAITPLKNPISRSLNKESGLEFIVGE